MTPEPWLRGPLEGVDPLLAPVLRALEQAREDLDNYCAPLTDRDIWLQPFGITSVGFHLRHIAGSLDRLTTYLNGAPLTDAQFAFLASESEPAGTRDELLHLIHQAIDQASQVVAALDLHRLSEPRTVGRNHLPTTAIGLATHLAEHTQRHVGQAITTCRLIEGLR